MQALCLSTSVRGDRPNIINEPANLRRLSSSEVSRKKVGKRQARWQV